jgi:hypothetical protein
MKKICPRCKIEKGMECFGRRKISQDGYGCWCKKCKKEYRERNKEKIKKQQKDWYEKNKIRVLKRRKEDYEEKKDFYKEKNKNNYEKHKDKYLAQEKIYREENKDLIRERRRGYRQKNKDKIYEQKKAYHERKMETDPSYRIKLRLSKRIRKSVKRSAGEKAYKTEELLGCTVPELMKHLESQFTEGMSWDNYGYWGWHIDHIIPCSCFDLRNSEEQKICFHYTNLQPLWQTDNLTKSNRIDL